MEEPPAVKKKVTKTLLIINCVLLAVGNTGGPLIMRLYFLEGGKRVWLSAALETGGWPLTFIPLIFTYFHRRTKARTGGATPGTGPASAGLFLMELPLFVGAAFVGVLTGIDDFLYASGVEKLPVSTSQLIIASQLGFTAIFAYVLVRQKFTAFSVNAVFLLTTAAAVLAINSKSARPDGESDTDYYFGFAMVMAAAVLYGFVLPMVELIYKKANQTLSYTLVLEFNLVMCFFGTAFCCIGMIINKDFQAIPGEASEYKLGLTMYYVVLLFNAVMWQCFFLGAIGVVYCASSLFSGILIAVLLPVTELLAVIFYHESFKAEKGLSLVLSLWGFVSYFYGEMKNKKPEKNNTEDVETELPQVMPNPSHSQTGPAQR